jgi:hypothetical protein
MRSLERLYLSLFLLISTTHAFVPFAHTLHPNIDMSALTVATLQPPETTIHASPASTPASSLPTSSDSPSDQSPEPELKPRQAQVTAPAAAIPDNPLQISPITTYEIDQVPPGGGAPVRVPVVYTQTFADVPDQWPAAGVGSIGMGSIQGQIGVVKTKRFVPFAVEIEVKTASTFTA